MLTDVECQIGEMRTVRLTKLKDITNSWFYANLITNIHLMFYSYWHFKDHQTEYVYHRALAQW